MWNISFSQVKKPTPFQQKKKHTRMLRAKWNLNVRIPFVRNRFCIQHDNLAYEFYSSEYKHKISHKLKQQQKIS